MAEDDPARRLPNGRFGPGNKPLGRRKKGTPNKATADVKAWLIAAANALGSDGKGAGGGEGFVTQCGRERAEALLTALLRLLPQVKPEPAEPVATASSVFLSVNVLPVPSGEYLSDATIEALRHKPQPLPAVIDNDDDTPPAA